MNAMYIITEDLSFEVSAQDLPSTYEWIEAQNICSALNDRWRLPSREELRLMYHLHKKAIGGFELKTYWSSEGLNNFHSYALSFLNANKFTGVGAKKPAPKYLVRPVSNMSVFSCV